MAKFKIDPELHSTFRKSLVSMIFLSAPAIVALAIIGGFAVLLLGSMPSCTPVEREGARTAIDVAGAACQLLERQDEEAWVKLVCAVIEGPGQVVKTVILRVPREKIAFAKDGSVRFLPVASAPVAASNSVSANAASSH